MAGPAALGLDLGTDEDEFMASATTPFPATTATFANHQAAAMEPETRSTIPTSNSIARQLLGGRTFTLGLPVLSLSSTANPSTREPPPPREMAGTNRVIRSWLQTLNPFRFASSEDKENVTATPDETSLPPPTTPVVPLSLEEKSTPDRYDEAQPAPLTNAIAHEPAPVMGALQLGGMTSQPPADETDGDTDTEGFAVRRGGVPRRGRRLVLPKRTSHPSADETETEGDTDNEGFAIPRAPPPGRGPPSRFGAPNVYFPEENGPMGRFESPAAFDTGSSMGGTPQSIFKQELPNPDATPEPASPALSQASLASDVVMMLSNNKDFRSWLVDHPQLKRKFDEVDGSTLPEAKRQKPWDEYDDEVFSADDSSSAAAEDTPEPEEMPHGPHFASSLESTSSFEPNAVHALIDPLVISEVQLNAQYCGPAKKDPNDERDYFYDFVSAVFGEPEWIKAYQLAQGLVNNADRNMKREMQRYRQAKTEPALYMPLESLAAKAMAVGSKAGGQQLTIMLTADQDMKSTVEVKKVDMLAVRHCDDGNPPDEPRAVDSQFAIELKHDGRMKESPPPKLHDHSTSEPPTSSFGRIIRATSSVKLDPIPQTILYAGQLLTSQSPHLRSVITLLVTWQRVQILVTDRGGTYISVERDFSGDWSILFGVLIAVQRSDGEFSGHEPSLRRLTKKGTKLPLEAFQPSEIGVQIGQSWTFAARVPPFAVEVESVGDPGEMFTVHAYGANLMGRPAAVSEKAALELVAVVNKAQKSKPALRKSLPRTKKAAKSVAPPDSPSQFNPESLYGSATVRFECAPEGNMDSTSTLQLSWQPAARVSEAVIMLYARQCGIKGVPTLIGWSVLANMDEGLVRSRLYESFFGLPLVRRVNMNLHALVWKEKLMPLWAVTSITSFLGALKSAVTTLDQLHTLGIFHANVGLSTLMVKTDEPSQAILVGFGMAQFQLEECENPDIENLDRFEQLRDEIETSSTQTPTASPSVAFLPIDQCTDTPRPVAARHAFESLFWTVIFILVNFRGGRMITDNGAVTDGWYTGNWGTIVNSKHGFLRDHGRSFPFAEPFARALNSDFEPLSRLILNWVGRMRRTGSLEAKSMLSALNAASEAYASR